MENNFYSVEMMGTTNKKMTELDSFNLDTIQEAKLTVVLKSGEQLTLSSDEIQIRFEEYEN